MNGPLDAKRILTQMGVRGTALVLALFVAGAPSALMACEVLCAATGAQSPQAGGHSCHETQPQDAPSVGGGGHICGHTDGLPLASRGLTSVSPPAPAMLAALPMRIDVSTTAPVRLSAAASSPPHCLTLTTQLRI